LGRGKKKKTLVRGGRSPVWSRENEGLDCKEKRTGSSICKTSLFSLSLRLKRGNLMEGAKGKEGNIRGGKGSYA